MQREVWAPPPVTELRIVPLGSSISLTVRQMGKAIYSVFFLGGSSSKLAVLATILMSASCYAFSC